EAQSGAQSNRVLQLLAAGPSSANALALGLGLKSKTGALKRTIKALVEQGLIAYTVPDKPDSRLQQYCLTEPGRQALVRQPHTASLEDEHE
ncbi:MAG: hypothetical protein Q4A97_08850, partial [Comamonadaceae bacterium]|nr:hypothetical protein [Comamonadaceae bacterium]